MQNTWFKREESEGLEWSRVKVADTILEFENEVFMLQLEAGKTYDIAWRMLNSKEKGAGKLTVSKSTSGKTGPWTKLVEDKLPKTQNTTANFTIFVA